MSNGGVLLRLLLEFVLGQVVGFGVDVYCDDDTEETEESE